MNSHRRTITSISMVFLAVTILSVSVLGQNAYAAGISLNVDADYDSGSISISGDTDNSNEVVIVIKSAPYDNIEDIRQLTPSGGSYSATIGTGGDQYKQDGIYTISAKQGDASMYNVSTEIEVVDGHVIPEFGTIAAMILVVAIIAIIAVSAKTKLSLVPKY